MYIYSVDESKAQPDQDFTVVGGIVLEETEIRSYDETDLFCLQKRKIDII